MNGIYKFQLVKSSKVRQTFNHLFLFNICCDAPVTTHTYESTKIDLWEYTALSLSVVAIFDSSKHLIEGVCQIDSQGSRKLTSKTLISLVQKALVSFDKCPLSGTNTTASRSGFLQMVIEEIMVQGSQPYVISLKIKSVTF